VARIIDVEGIGEAYSQKLQAAGITKTEQLLETGKTPQGRKELETKSGISHSKILEWVNHVDLYRIKGIASEYSDLLEAAGVDTVPELAQRRPDNLHGKLVEVNADKHLVRRIPTLRQVTDWVDQAKALPRIIVY